MDTTPKTVPEEDSASIPCEAVPDVEDTGEAAPAASFQSQGDGIAYLQTADIEASNQRHVATSAFSDSDEEKESDGRASAETSPTDRPVTPDAQIVDVEEYPPSPEQTPRTARRLQHERSRGYNRRFRPRTAVASLGEDLIGPFTPVPHVNEEGGMVDKERSFRLTGVRVKKPSVGDQKLPSRPSLLNPNAPSRSPSSPTSLLSLQIPTTPSADSSTDLEPASRSAFSPESDSGDDHEPDEEEQSGLAAKPKLKNPDESHFSNTSPALTRGKHVKHRLDPVPEDELLRWFNGDREPTEQQLEELTGMGTREALETAEKYNSTSHLTTPGDGGDARDYLARKRSKLNFHAEASRHRRPTLPEDAHFYVEVTRALAHRYRRERNEAVDQVRTVKKVYGGRELEARIVELTQQLEERTAVLTYRLTNAEQERDATRKKYSKAKDWLRTSQANVARLNAFIDRLQTECDELQSQNARLQQRVDAQADRVDRRVVAELEAQLEQAQAQAQAAGDGTQAFPHSSSSSLPLPSEPRHHQLRVREWRASPSWHARRDTLRHTRAAEAAACARVDELRRAAYENLRARLARAVPEATRERGERGGERRWGSDELNALYRRLGAVEIRG